MQQTKQQTAIAQPVQQQKSLSIQPKLTIGASNDRYEREADAMADRIMRMPQAFSNQPLSSNGASSIQRACSACAHEEDPIRRKPLMMKSDGDTPVATPALSQQLTSSKGGGSPLSSATNNFMSQAFGTDFSHVRVHTNSSAIQMNEGLNASAFAHGTDIYFNRGQYQPSSSKGKRLIGHELTHVVQQGGNRPMPSLQLKPLAAPKSCLNGGLKNPKQSKVLNTVTLYKQGAKGTLIPKKNNQLQVKDHDGKNLGLRENKITIGQEGRFSFWACFQFNQEDPQIYFVSKNAVSRPDQLESEEQKQALTDDQKLARIIKRHEKLNINDREAVLRAVQDLSNTNPSEAVLLGFIQHLELKAMAAGQVSPLDSIQMEQKLDNLRVRRRGPFGMRGPGILAPVAAEMLRPFFNAFLGAKGYVEGVVLGFKESATDKDYRRLLHKLGASAVITTVFPPVFLTGAVLGILEDIVDAVKGIYKTIVDFDKVVEAVVELIKMMVSDKSEELGKALGKITGKGYVQKLRKLLDQNIVKFTFDLGRLIGPTIIYAVLSLVGLPAILGAVGVSMKVVRAMRTIINRIPGGRKLRALLRLMRRRRKKVAAALLIKGGRLRVTIAHLLNWEAKGGHMLQRHGPFHTKDTLLKRILNETSLGGAPAPQTLPGGAKMTDFRLWRGKKDLSASAWKDDDTMRDVLGKLINDNLNDIDRTTKNGGRIVLKAHDLQKPIGKGWLTAIKDGKNSERAMYWTEKLQKATVVIDPHPLGGWYVVTAFPHL